MHRGCMINLWAVRPLTFLRNLVASCSGRAIDGVQLKTFVAAVIAVGG